MTLRGGEVLCFARGTRLLMTRAEFPVAALRVGDVMVTFFDEGATLKPVRWIGHRLVDCRRQARSRDVWRVRCAAGASATITTSPVTRTRCLLAQCAALFDRRGERRDGDPGADEPSKILNIKLETHDLLLAEGLRIECQLDSGNCSAFQARYGAILPYGVLDPSSRGHSCRLPLAESGLAVTALRACSMHVQRYVASSAAPTTNRG